MSKTQKSLLFLLAFLAASSLAGRFSLAADGQEVYKKICSFCHDDGTIGAPKTGDRAEWRRRAAKGMNVLYANTLGGVGHMPPRQERRGYSEDDIKAAVDYLMGITRVPARPTPVPLKTP